MDLRARRRSARHEVKTDEKCDRSNKENCALELAPRGKPLIVARPMQSEDIYRTPGEVPIRLIPRPTSTPDGVAVVGGDDHFTRLPNELLQTIFAMLPRKSLVALQMTCRRFYAASSHHSLWERIDLHDRQQIAESCLHVLFNRGVQIVRLTRSTVTAQPTILDAPRLSYTANSALVTHLDMSSASFVDLATPTVEPRIDVLNILLARCVLLQALSLERVLVNTATIETLAACGKMEMLHLGMLEVDEPSDETVEAFGRMIAAMEKLRELNVSWMRAGNCTGLQYAAAIVHRVAEKLPSSIRRLNIAGYGGDTPICDETVNCIVRRCPFIEELDISDCSRIGTEAAVNLLTKCRQLSVLHASRAYDIDPGIYLHYCGNIRELNIYNCITEEGEIMLRGRLPNTHINRNPHSTIARPTTGLRMTSIWLQRTRDLYS